MRLVLTLLLFAGSLQAADDYRTHLALSREAQAAYERRDYPAARKAIQGALELRPDSPRYLQSLAGLSARVGDTDAALAALRRLAALGVSRPVERDPDLATLQGTPPFLKILQQFSENRSPQGEAEVFAELPGRLGIFEGIAFRPKTSDLFLSDVYHRCVWRRDSEGRIARFTAPDETLFGMFGLVVDETRNALWVAMTALPEMQDYTEEMKGHAALAEFNLATSELRRVIPLPGDSQEHGLGDIVLAKNGTLYLSDSKAPIIWELAPGEEELFKFVESPLFSSLQGMVIVDRTLIVADYDNGLFAVDLARDGAVRALGRPQNTTLVGIDGLTLLPDGIAATQNGVDPQRVLRLRLAPDQQSIADVTVLAAAQPGMTDLALVASINDRPTYIAGSGWDDYAPAVLTDRQPRPRTVRIFQATVPP